MTDPLETLPGASIKLIIAFPTVLFPEPDSPTSPKIHLLQHEQFPFSLGNRHLNF